MSIDISMVILASVASPIPTSQHNHNTLPLQHAIIYHNHLIYYYKNNITLQYLTFFLHFLSGSVVFIGVHCGGADPGDAGGGGQEGVRTLPGAGEGHPEGTGPAAGRVTQDTQDDRTQDTRKTTARNQQHRLLHVL